MMQEKFSSTTSKAQKLLRFFKHNIDLQFLSYQFSKVIIIILSYVYFESLFYKCSKIPYLNSI